MWLQKFLHRPGIVDLIGLYGTAGESDRENIRNRMVQLSKRLVKCKPGHVYNDLLKRLGEVG